MVDREGQLEPLSRKLATGVSATGVIAQDVYLRILLCEAISQCRNALHRTEVGNLQANPVVSGRCDNSGLCCPTFVRTTANQHHLGPLFSEALSCIESDTRVCTSDDINFLCERIHNLLRL